MIGLHGGIARTITRGLTRRPGWAAAVGTHRTLKWLRMAMADCSPVGCTGGIHWDAGALSMRSSRTDMRCEEPL